MLTIFPNLLFLAPFSATIIRFAVGLFFIYTAFALHADRREIARSRLPIIGFPRPWMVYLTCVVLIVIAAALIVGFGTQVAAIAGMAVIAIHLAIPRSWLHPGIDPIARSAHLLLFIMCLTLLITGAGPLAYDLPI